MTDLIEIAQEVTGGEPKATLRRLTDALANPRQPGEAGVSDMDAALTHLFKKGFNPKVVLDIGAAKGYWTQGTAYRWPAAAFFMIDPLLESEPDLKLICQDPRFHYLRLAIGDEPGEMLMHVATEPDSSSLLLSNNPDPDSHQAVTICTIDQLLDSGQIKPAQLVKIDVQGFELNVLRGASQLFDTAEVFIIEANLFKFMPGCPRLHELIGFMADRGFYPFDFAGFLRRPFENDLGQVDVVFVNQHSPLVSSNRWLNEPPTLDGPSTPSLGDGLIISVIICTHDPRPDIFNRAMDALDRQTLDKNRFEVIIVDSASRFELEMDQLTAGRTLDMKVVREESPGLSRARCAGISHATGELLVFVDDDNFLAPDYLDCALRIARTESRVGIFGGITEAELESPIPDWKKPVLAHLGVRDYGNQPITKFADRWGKWEPIGAGMVARRSVAERFVRMYRQIPEARVLGRSGAAMLSGEDSLMARAAYRQGYACSYQPSLRLKHFIKASRLTAGYMSKVVEGHGRSYVVLQRALGKPVAPIPVHTAMARLLFRLSDSGRAGFITRRWELGYARECRSPSIAADVETRQPEVLPPPTIAISVVLCTRNPRADLLEATLDSLERQSVSRTDFELIIIDNASTPPVDQMQVSRSRSMRISIVIEPREGHVFARCAGIRASKGALILFVDDDNFLDTDYLEKAMRIAADEPKIGAFGGIAEPSFDQPPATWKLSLLKYLAVRDHGPEVITSKDDDWGAWEPIGAGMVARRNVAERFVRWIRDVPGADTLGRSDRYLMSGDDALFSRAAHRMGFSTSYQPALKLTHHIKSDRFRLRYLMRLLSGHGRTLVLLNQIMQTPVSRVTLWKTIRLLAYRIRQQRSVGVLMWSWDVGYFLQQRKTKADK